MDSCTRGFFTYTLLDLARRYKFQPLFDADDIDSSISNHFDILHNLIQDTWGDHRCLEPGCGTILVIDGNMKSLRKVCAARISAYHKFKYSGAEVMTGCKNMPSPGEQFCSEHLKSEVPSIPFQKMTRENVKSLHSTRKATKGEKVDEDVFNIVGLHKKKESGKGYLYLVEWEGYTVKTWEKEENIPKFLRDYYQRTGNTSIPKPRVKSVKSVGSGQHFLLAWDKTNEPDTYVPREDFVISQWEEEEMVSCRTRKHVGARFCKTSGGIFIGCYPCGVIPVFEEIYGTESISQVYGHIVEWIGETKPRDLKYILYDDACHLGPYAKKDTRKSFGSATSTMGTLEFFVDKMHFKGHTSKVCHEKFNPYSCADLSGVNTQVAEQSFKWTNAFKQVKSMNHSRFRLFFTYILDLHNLQNTNKLHLSHPLNESITEKPAKDGTEALQTAFEHLNVDTKKTTPTKEDVKASETCPICGKSFKSKSGLTRHLKSIHKDEELPLPTGLKCPWCDKYCKNQSGLRRHQDTKHKDEMH